MMPIQIQGGARVVADGGAVQNLLEVLGGEVVARKIKTTTIGGLETHTKRKVEK